VCRVAPFFSSFIAKVSLNLFGCPLLPATLHMRDTVFRAFPITARSFDFPDRRNRASRPVALEELR
jgi:hypothetical protein